MGLTRKVGRPRKGIGKRDKVVTFRVNQHEYDYIRKKAEEEDMSIADFLLATVICYQKRWP